MKEADYAKDKHALVHWMLSSLVVGFVLFLAVKNGHLSAGRAIAYLAVPISCIWFPDAVATLKDELVSPKTIRIGGWVLLLVIVIYPYFLKLLSS